MKNITLIFALLAIVFSACNRDEIFEREMYKARVAVKGDMSGGYNIYEQEHDFDLADESGWTQGFIAASVGGSLPTTEPIVLTIVEDTDLLQSYNQTNFGTDDYRYAQLLSKDRYEVSGNMSITIPAGQREGIMPIRFRLEGLSPDSMYVIPFKVEKCSAYELNLDKSNVLYRIHFKNFWSSTKTITEYSHRGYRLEADRLDEDPRPIRTPTYLNKRVYPISRNEIRLDCGIKAYSADDDQLQVIPKWSILITIHNDGSMNIEPLYKTHLGITVKQVNNDNFDGNDRYLNTYELVDDGFGKLYRTFRLCYDYTDPDNKIDYRMWEELKLEYKELIIQ